MARKKRMVQEQVLGERIRNVRKKKGITQGELSQKLGVTQRVISYYENSGTNLSMEILQKIADALETPIKKFFENKGPIEESPFSPAIQKKLNLVALLPSSDQQYILKTIEMLAFKNGL